MNRHTPGTRRPYPYLELLLLVPLPIALIATAVGASRIIFAAAVLPVAWELWSPQREQVSPWQYPVNAAAVLVSIACWLVLVGSSWLLTVVVVGAASGALFWRWRHPRG